MIMNMIMTMIMIMIMIMINISEFVLIFEEKVEHRAGF